MRNFLAWIFALAICLSVAFSSCSSAKESEEIPPEVPEPSSAITLSAGSFEFEADGGSADLRIESELECSAVVPTEFSSWISVDASPSEASSVIISVSPNDKVPGREGRVEISNGKAGKSVAILQKGSLPVLTLSTTQVDLGSEGGTFSVGVTSNMSVSVVKPSVDWIREVEATDGESKYSFVVDENSTFSSRSAEIVFRGEESGLEASVAVSQNGRKDPNAVSILAIGNSFSVDSMEYLYDILTQMGYTSVKLGNLYIGGCTLETHARNIASGSGAYTYYVNTTGSWKSNTSYSSVQALKSEEWDYVSLQQASGSSGVSSTYEPYLSEIVSKVKQLCPSARLVWNMTWAYQGNSSHSEFPKYDRDQMKMYNAIVSAVQEMVVSRGDFDMIIPTGTAVQNLRTSMYGDNLTRDGYHLAYGPGRLAAAMMWARRITGRSLDNVNWTPQGKGIFTPGRYAAIKEAVENAFAEPYAVTESKLKEDDLKPEDVLGYMLKDAGYDPENYTRLSVELTDRAYYHSGRGNADLNVNDSWSDGFAATGIFTKSQIPSGSIIVVQSGYQYRPEGWTSLSQKTNPRPDNVSKTIVVVSDAWWGSFNYRAFNISKTGVSKPSDSDFKAMRDAFGIFVPKRD